MRSKGDRGFIDTKKEMLWIEWQTLTRHYTDDQLIIGEWFYDIYQKYSEPIRFYFLSLNESQLQMGNLVIGLGTLGAQLGHTWGTKLYFLGHTWGTLGAQLGHSWGKKLLGAHLGQKQLGHSWGKKVT